MTQYRWVRDERTGMYWQMPVATRFSRRAFSAEESMRAALAYMRGRYGGRS